jgi:prostaglandin-E synthase 1
MDLKELLTSPLPRLMLEIPGFRAYAVSVFVLAVKMYAVAIYTGSVRGKLKLALNPEDAKAFGAQQTNQEHPDVERVLRAHRNDMENIPLYFALGLVAVLAGAPALGLHICIGAFTVARVAHSLFYIKGVQPWRSASWGVGLLASLALGIMTLIRVFFA